MATRTISNAGGNYNSTGSWVEAVVPTSGDDVVATGTSGNLTVNVSSACRSADFANYVGTLAGNAARIWTVGDGSGGALKLVVGMGFSPNTAFRVTFASTIAGNQITSVGKSFALVTFNGAAGSWLLQDDFSSLSTTLTNGELDFNGNNLTCTVFLIAAGTKTLTMGSKTLTLTGTGTVFNNANPTNFTLTAGAHTIAVTDTSASSKTFLGGGKTFNNLLVTTGGSGAVIFADSNTFANIQVIGGTAKTLTFTAGTTQTLTGGAFPSGAASNLIACQSSSAGSAWTLSSSADMVCDYLSLSDCAMTGGGKLYAGPHSVDGGGNNANVLFGWQGNTCLGLQDGTGDLLLQSGSGCLLGQAGVAAPSILFRKTFSGIGTGAGKRQLVGV